MKTALFALGLLLAPLGVRHVLAQNDADITGTVLAAPSGRFVFGQMGGSGEDQYMLDTQTGRLWKLESPGGSLTLVPVSYLAHDATKTVLPPDNDKEPVTKPGSSK